MLCQTYLRNEAENIEASLGVLLKLVHCRYFEPMHQILSDGKIATSSQKLTFWDIIIVFLHSKISP